jgi:Tfp pilus assembly protein PilZ
MKHSTEYGRRTGIKPRLLEFIGGLSEEQCKKIFQNLQTVTSKDQRGHPRIACSIPVDYDTKNGPYAGFIKDISKGGVFIETRAQLDVGEEIKMTFSSPSQKKPIKFAGRVVRKNMLGVSVRFEKTTEVVDKSTWIDCRRTVTETSEERRMDPRVDLQCPVYIEGIREVKTITDLSLGGVFVECDAVSRNRFRTGQLITLNMKLPTESDMIRVKAQVVGNNDRGLHCQFAHLGRETAHAIHHCFHLAKHVIPIK